MLESKDPEQVEYLGLSQESDEEHHLVQVFEVFQLLVHIGQLRVVPNPPQVLERQGFVRLSLLQRVHA